MQTSTDLSRLAAGNALLNNDPVAALEHARRAVEAESKDFRDLVWLGQMLDAGNKSDEGLQKLRRAVELKPTDPAPHVALVKTLAGRGREGEAAALIENVKTEVDPQRRAIALAECYEAVNNPDKARDYYDEALQAQPGDIAVVRAVIQHRMRTNRLGGAEHELRRMVNGEVEANEEDTQWARYALALVLANGTDYGRFQEALTLAGVKVEANGELARDTSRIRVERTEAVLTRARLGDPADPGLPRAGHRIVRHPRP